MIKSRHIKLKGRPGMIFADWLKEQIESRRITKTAFAESVGVSRAALDKWLSGENRPDDSNAERVAEALDVSLNVVHRMLGRIEEELPITPEAANIAHQIDSIEDEEVRGELISAVENMIRITKRLDAR